MLDLNKIIENTDLKYHKYLTKEKIIIFKQIASTNSYLLDCAKNPDNQLIFCLAEMQTAGRGRLNRNWSSPLGNIYLSILWKFNPNLKNLLGLSPAIAVAISRTLAAYGIENISLKWPNDILYEHSKLAGILIETLAGIKHAQAVIGIGMNINNASMLEDDLAINNTSRLTKSNKLLPKPFPKQFLMNINNNTNNINIIFDLNILLGLLITNILDILLIFEIQGLVPFVTEWQLKNYTLNKLVTIYNHNEQSIITGLNKGIDNNGALIIEKFDNINHKYELIKIYSGEVSVR